MGNHRTDHPRISTEPQARPTRTLPACANSYSRAAPLNQLANPKSIGRRLRNHVDEPVRSRGRTLVLRKQDDHHTKQAKYFVEVRVE